MVVQWDSNSKFGFKMELEFCKNHSGDVYTFTRNESIRGTDIRCSIPNTSLTELKSIQSAQPRYVEDPSRPPTFNKRKYWTTKTINADCHSHYACVTRQATLKTNPNVPVFRPGGCFRAYMDDPTSFFCIHVPEKMFFDKKRDCHVRIRPRTYYYRSADIVCVFTQYILQNPKSVHRKFHKERKHKFKTLVLLPLQVLKHIEIGRETYLREVVKPILERPHPILYWNACLPAALDAVRKVYSEKDLQAYLSVDENCPLGIPARRLQTVS